MTRISVFKQLPLAVCALVMLSSPALSSPSEQAQRFIGRTVEESSPAHWPAPAKAPKDAPNVLLIMTDDVGFGSSSTFGGPIPTPTFDELAKQGLRYNRFHTTALCSPTRASLLTGRYPHNVNIGNTTNWPTGYAGYTSVIPDSAATIADILQARGFATAMFGKSHLTPEWELSPSGPYDRWPTGLGFQYFYGFLGADMDNFAPILHENTTPVAPARGKQAYHLEADLADRATAWIRTQNAVAPDKPLFIYYATGAAHAPNQAPAEWLARFKGRFDHGWDRMRAETYARQQALGIIPQQAGLAPRPEKLPAWSSLSEQHKRLYARYMEAYAASLSYADDQVGRVIAALKETGRYDNTLIIYIQGDNGASAEGRMHGRLYEQEAVNGYPVAMDHAIDRIDDIGGPATYPLIPGGWAWAMNAPFPHAKRIASHLGGTRNGMVISWPKRIRAGGAVLPQFHHVSDVMPTILEAVGVQAPHEFNGVRQLPLDGISMAYTFNDTDAPSQRKTQVFEVFQNLALYHDGWLVSTKPVGSFWGASPAKPVALENRGWELYDLRADYSQVQDLARSEPARLAAMQQLFWVEAARNNMLPIHSHLEGREGRPSLAAARSTFRYTPGIEYIPEDGAPPIIGRPFTISAVVDIPEGGARGVLVAQGGRFGGYALYLHDGHAVFYYNAVPPAAYAVRSADRLTAGRHDIVLKFAPNPGPPSAGGVATLYIDGKQSASGPVGRTLATWISHTEGFDVGVDHGTAVSPDYAVEESRFTGVLAGLTITLD